MTHIPIMILLVALVAGVGLFAGAIESGKWPRRTSDLPNHFRNALGALQRNRWLFIFPFLMTAIEMLLSLPITLAAMYRQSNMGLVQNVPAFHRPPLDILAPEAVHQIWPALWTALRFSTAPVGSFISGAWSVAVLAVCFLALLFLGTKPDWLLNAERKHPEAFRSLKVAAGVSVIAMLISLALLYFSLVVMTTHQLAIFWKGALLFLPGYLLGLSEVWVISLVLALYCTAALHTLESREISFNTMFQEGLKMFPAMFAFEAAIMAVIVVLSAIHLFTTINGMWLEPLIRFATASIPFLIVVKTIGPQDILRSQIHFLKRHTVDYVLFILSGTAILFLPIYLGDLLGLIMAPLSVPSYDAGIVMGALQCFLAAWYMVAFMDWVRQNEDRSYAATDAELDAFQRKHKVLLPLGLRDYLKKNWGPSFVSDLVSLQGLDGLEIRKEKDGTVWCIFADYSIRIYEFGIQLTDQQSTAVYVMYPSPGLRITDSIEEFVELLLAPEDNESATFWASAMVLSEEDIRSFKLHQAKKPHR